VVTHEDVLKIANLARLSIKEEELDRLTKEMDSMIAFADTINTAADEASDFDNINNLSNAFREDIVIPSLDREQILKNAESQQGGYFLVKKRN
jgi:aspartyl-tRNA(Asn)/glutamyl-tRNA(Gln) amidotransferase subunit C